MRALAVLIACLAVTPAAAFGHAGGGPHPSFPHGGPHSGPHGGGGHGSHDHHGQFFYGGSSGYDTVPYVTPDETSAPAQETPVVEFPPLQRCPIFEPAPTRPVGPHIIYIGSRPRIDGPKVIYGTD